MMVELKFRIKLAFGLWVLVCLARPLHSEDPICKVANGTTSCNDQYGPWPGRHPNEVLQQRAAGCVSEECEGDSCHEPNFDSVQGVPFNDWMLARVALIHAVSGVPGHFYDKYSDFICSQLIYCDKCQHYADREAHPAGKYCAISVLDIQPIEQYSKLIECTGLLLPPSGTP
jgi:hypothetical protein